MRILCEIDTGVPSPRMDVPQPMSDPELLGRALAGDEDAFRALYDRLKVGIFRYAFYMTNSRQTAEEVTQEVFITLLHKGRGYDPAHGDVGAFTFGIARNLVHRALRRQHSYLKLFIGEPKEDHAVSDTTLGDLIRDQRVADVRAAVASLPEHYRQVVVLCDLLEFSYADAAERLDCAIGTVRSRLSRGHALLAQKLRLHADREHAHNPGAEGCLT